MTQIVINMYCCKGSCKKYHCQKRKHKRRKRGCTNRKKKNYRRSRRKTRKKICCRVRKINIKCPKHPKVSIRPIVKRYFFIAPEDIDVSEGLTIQANQFVDDKGEPIHKFTSFGKEGYYNLFVNGVLQEGNLYLIKTNALKVTEMEQTILNGTPIIVESVGFTTKLIYK